MTSTELQVLKENRADGETLNETKYRLVKEGRLVPVRDCEHEEYEGDEDGFLQEDLSIPRWKIIQPTNRIEGAKVGTFRNALTGLEREKMENIVFLRRQNGRILFPKDDFSGERECFSYDGLAPAREEIIAKTGNEPKSECCVKKIGGQKIVCCSCAMWNNDDKNEDTSNRAPMCKEVITFLGVDKEMFPLWLSFHGTAIPVVKKLISSIYLQKKQAAVKGKSLHLRDFRMTIGLKLQITEKGKFYVPVFEKVESLNDPEEQKLLDKCFEALQRKEISESLAMEESQ